MGPLSGFRVLEFEGIGPGPFCAMVLSDMGATVLRVARPQPPSDGSGMAALTEGVLGRGRATVVLDLKHPGGRAAALDLVARADASVEGFRPGVMERLGLGPATCLQRNPRLVYGRLTGWGQEGPLAAAAGHDLNYIALAGVLAHLGRRSEPPSAPLNLIGDFAGGGMLMALGIVAGLLETSRSGRGQVVDAAMVDGSAYLMSMMFELMGRNAWNTDRESNPNDGGAHFYDVYETADGRYVSVAAMEPRFYAELLARAGVPTDLLPEQWDQRAWPSLKERFAALFAARTRAEWCALLEGTDACFAPVLDMSEAPHHPHNVHRDVFVEVDGVLRPAPAPRFSRTPSSANQAVPTSAEAALTSWGVPEAAVADLRGRGILRDD